MAGSAVPTTPMISSMEETAPSQVPPVHLELEALFKSLIQLNEVIEELSKRLIPVSAPAVALDEASRSVPSNHCSVARQIAEARMSVQDKITTLLKMLDGLQI